VALAKFMRLSEETNIVCIIFFDFSPPMGMKRSPNKTRFILPRVANAGE
jgi:hypothetical protein